jgi:hypothetical protein
MQMTAMKKAILVLLAVGVLVGGAAGVAVAEANNPNLITTHHPGYAPDHNYPMNTTQPGWEHWDSMGSDIAGVSAPAPTSQGEPVVPVPGNDERSYDSR